MPIAAPPLLARLREATRAHHAAVERTFDLLADGVTEATFASFLGALHGFVAPLEARLARVTGEAPRRAPRIASDLRALGFVPELLPVATVPAPGSPAESLGARYVLEGSALGTKVIGRHLGTRLPATVARARAWIGLGDDAAARFSALVAELGTQDEAAAPAVVRGAEEAFASLAAWFSWWTSVGGRMESMGQQGLPRLRERFLAAQLAGDRREALRLVVGEGLASGLPATTIQRDVIGAAQREIGRLWEENVISIAQEHLATAVAHVALAHVFEQAPAGPRNGRTVLVACVEGELHDFPARLAADALDLAGFDVRFLGANVPTASYASIVNAVQPHLVALSATMAFHLPALRDAVAELRRHTTAPVLAGGSACALLERAEIGADRIGGDAAGLVAHAQELLGVAA